MTSPQKHLDKIIHAWLTPLVPEDIQKLINIATFDVLNGPFTESDCEGDLEGYPGYEAAQEKIQAFLDGFPHKRVWVDTDCEYVALSEREGEWVPSEVEGEADVWVEPDNENTFYLEWPDLKKYILGSTLNSQW